MRTIIKEDMVRVRDMPVDLIPEDAITDLQEAIGKMPITDLSTGEILLASRLVEPTNITRNIALAIPKGHVIVALPADDLLNRVGMVKPGDRVDILITLPYGDGPENTVSVDVLQNVVIQAVVVPPIPNEVESAGEQVKATADAALSSIEGAAFKAILVAISPQDALVLKYLRDSGAILDFALRAPDDESAPFLDPVDFQYIQDVFGIELSTPEQSNVIPGTLPTSQPLPVPTSTP